MHSLDGEIHPWVLGMWSLDGETIHWWALSMRSLDVGGSTSVGTGHEQS